MLGTFQLYYPRLDLISGLLVVGSGAPHGKRRTDLFLREAGSTFRTERQAKQRYFYCWAKAPLLRKKRDT